MKIISNGVEVDVPVGGGTSQEIYSTEETRIGTWIDGKPLYRRVFNVTTPLTASTSTSEILHVSIPVETIVHILGVSKSTSGQWRSVPYYITDTDRVYIGYNPPDHTSMPNSLRCSCGSDLVNKPLIIVLEYTKTTDQVTIQTDQTLQINLGQFTDETQFSSSAVSAAYDNLEGIF